MTNNALPYRSTDSTFIRLTKLLSQQTWLLILALIGTIIQVGLTVYLPILIGQAVNHIVALADVDFLELRRIVFEMFIIIVLNAIVQWFNPIIYNRMVYKTVQNLRQQVLEKMHHLPFHFLDQRSVGDMVSRITTDTEQLADGMIMVFNQFFVGVLTILITIVTMARLDIVMMLLVVLLTPLSLFIARFIATKSYRLFQQQTVARGRHTEVIEESVQQSELIRLFNIHKQKQAEFDDINEEYTYYSKWAIFYSSTINPTTRFVNAIIYAVLTFAGAVRIINGSFTVGELTTFLNYANQYMKPFNDISNVLAEIQSALACGDRLFEIIDQANEQETGLLEMKGEDIEGRVGFNQVAFSYSPEQELIRNLTLSVKPGQTVAIVGPTGAGKSTLINLLMRFYDVNEGQILVDNQPIVDYTRASVRAQFGMVLQETWLKSGTIHENIAYGFPNASRDDVIRAAKAAHAHRFISMLPNDYDTYLSNSGANLSMGQRQLLAISRIFVSLPEMLILDEATSSIDTRTEILIQQAFNALMEGRTSFIIAHRLSTIQNADLILVMRNGQVIEQGNHEELMILRGFYYEMQTAGDKV